MADRTIAFRRSASALLAASLFCVALGAGAAQNPLVGYEDIDLFVTSDNTGAPNVLIVLDNSANWSSTLGSGTKFSASKSALSSVVSGLTTQFNIGLQFYTDTDSNNVNNNPDGGYVRFAIQPMTTADGNATPERNCLLRMVGAGTECTLPNNTHYTNLHENADKGNNAKPSLAMAEAYRYFTGGTAHAGSDKAKTDYTRVFTSGTITGKTYQAPTSTASCVKNYIIFISNGPFNENSSATATATSLLTSSGGDPTVINPPDNGSSNNTMADEWTRWLNKSPVGAITYVIEVGPSTTGQGPYQSRLLNSMAVQGGGAYYAAKDAAALNAALARIFNQIQAGNSVFASSALPVSINSQGTFLNQIFMGMFRPDGVSSPRWMGNLKQYRFSYDNTTQQLSLSDASGASAINPTTGFITPDAVSFWTASLPYTDYWKNITVPKGEPNVGGASDFPDGQLVEKGGAAQRLREAFMTDRSGRKVYTCIGSACTPPSGGSTSLTAAAQSFTTANTAITQAMLGAASSTERDAIINWVRGADNNSPSDEQGPGTVTHVSGSSSTTVNATVRASIHGDVLHSSPAVINYGGSTGIVVFYGANDGLMRAVRGEQIGGGNELWAFAPEEFLGKFKRLRDNSPPILYATSNETSNPAPQRKDYGMDGPITFYQKGGTNGTSQAMIYAAMRRGGRALYAFDVTDPTAPKLKWKKTSSHISGLGQTWSDARVTRIKNYSNPVLVMGGGYDPVEDSLTPGAPTMGNIVVVLDAIDGSVLKVFTGISRPVPAPLALVDLDEDGRMDRAYAVDLGGNIYRLVFPSADPNEWTITKIADFSGSTSASQKMFYAPAATVTRPASGDPIVALQVGTGDREKPLQKTGTENRFFTVLDRGQTAPVALNDLVQMTAAGLSNLPADSYGCYYNLPNTGEKVVNGVVYVGGASYFGTNSPSSNQNQCSNNLGDARAYGIPAFCGPVRVQSLVGGGFPPTPVVGSVLISKDGSNCETHPQNCITVPVMTGAGPLLDCDGNEVPNISGLGGQKPPACPPANRLRRSWNIMNPR